ncbi:MAG: hypothetical protein ACREQ5_06390 [Candidatus Dormibacteria bacterium]
MAKAKKESQPVQSFEDFKFDAVKEYRIHFANGHSGEYHGRALVHGLPFDVSQIVSVDAMEPPKEEEADGGEGQAV